MYIFFQRKSGSRVGIQRIRRTQANYNILNILAHLYLSGDSDEILVGNFIADFVNGEEALAYQQRIYLGILLHREIDRFTNNHHLFSQSKKRLWQRHRHYSAVIVDIFYDHFLAKHWRDYSSIKLQEFADLAYSALRKFEDNLPAKAKFVVPHMITNNWLVNYSKLEGIDRAMQGLARRASYPSKMASSVRDLESDYTAFENDFRLFFPLLINHTSATLDNLKNSSLA